MDLYGYIRSWKFQQDDEVWIQLLLNCYNVIYGCYFPLKLAYDKDFITLYKLFPF